MIHGAASWSMGQTLEPIADAGWTRGARHEGERTGTSARQARLLPLRRNKKTVQLHEWQVAVEAGRTWIAVAAAVK